MKHKYNVGDKVWLIWNEDRGLQIEVGTIHKQLPKGQYRFEQFGGMWLEKWIYTPAEALEFITNYINKDD